MSVAPGLAPLGLSGPRVGRARLSLVAPCYNEVGNVGELYERVVAALGSQTDLEWEIIFIDNASTDGTLAAIRALIERDGRVRAIANARNYGPVRSIYHGMMQANGDAVVLVASDLQDPPELLPEFVRLWRSGAEVVLAVKESSEEPLPLFLLRSAYYRLVSTFSNVELTAHATGFGLYDAAVIRVLRTIPDTYPYFRGLVHDLGFSIQTVTYRQPLRRRGITKNNLLTLYDQGMLGVTNHAKVSLRLATMLGFVVAGLCLMVAMVYLTLKLLYWNDFPAIGQAPTVVGLFFIGAVQLFFIGLLGEYVLAIHTQVHRRPRVLERVRLNFPPGELDARTDTTMEGGQT